MCCWLCRWSRC